MSSAPNWYSLQEVGHLNLFHTSRRIWDVSGADNSVHDALLLIHPLRLSPTPSVYLDTNAQVQATETDADQFPQKMPLCLAAVFFIASQSTILCHLSQVLLKPMIPTGHHYFTFLMFGDLAHQLVTAPVNLVWFSIERETLQWSCTCFRCQRRKVHRYPEASLAKFPHPKTRPHYANVGFRAALSPLHGYVSHTCLKCFTRWPKATTICSPNSCESEGLLCRIGLFGCSALVIP